MEKFFYFTSFIDYALLYQFYATKIRNIFELEKYIFEKERSEFQIMLFLVNLGKCEEIPKQVKFHHKKETWPFFGKDLSDEIDSRHIIVGRKKFKEHEFQTFKHFSR